MSSDKNIQGLLQQPLLAAAWEAVSDATSIYTWRPKDAQRLKECLEYARLEPGSISDDPQTLPRALAKMALDCASYQASGRCGLD